MFFFTISLNWKSLKNKKKLKNVYMKKGIRLIPCIKIKLQWSMHLTFPWKIWKSVEKYVEGYEWLMKTDGVLLEK